MAKKDTAFEDELAALQDQLNADFGGDAEEERPAVDTGNLIYTVGAVGKDAAIWIVLLILALIGWRMAKKFHVI